MPETAPVAFDAPLPEPVPLDSPFAIDFGAPVLDSSPSLPSAKPQEYSSPMEPVDVPPLSTAGMDVFADDDGGFEMDDPMDLDRLGGTGGASRQFTRYNVCNFWQELVHGISSNGSGFLAVCLNGTTLVHGDFQNNPFRLTVLFPAAFSWGYTQMTTLEEYRQKLENFLEDRLQTKVVVSYELQEPKPGEEISTVPLSPWESDVKLEPVLAEFAQKFVAELVTTRSLPRTVEEPVECGDSCAAEQE